MDEKEEQELIEKGLRYRPRIKEARTYIVDKDGNEIEEKIKVEAKAEVEEI